MSGTRRIGAAYDAACNTHACCTLQLFKRNSYLPDINTVESGACGFECSTPARDRCGFEFYETSNALKIQRTVFERQRAIIPDKFTIKPNSMKVYSLVLQCPTISKVTV